MTYLAFFRNDLEVFLLLLLLRGGGWLLFVCCYTNQAADTPKRGAARGGLGQVIGPKGGAEEGHLAAAGGESGQLRMAPKRPGKRRTTPFLLLGFPTKKDKEEPQKGEDLW